MVLAAATSMNVIGPLPMSPTEVLNPAEANPGRLLAEKLPSVAGGSASTTTTGTTIRPMIQASRSRRGSGDRTRAVASRPRDAIVSRAAPTGTTQFVRVDRY